MAKQPQNFPVQVDPANSSAGVFLFERMTATERLSEPFCYELSVLSAKRDIKSDDVLGLGQPVTVSVKLPGGGARPFNGLVTRFVRTGEQTAGTTQSARQLYRYQLRLQPWLWFLTRTSDCRVFQQKSVTDIFKAVCQGHGFTDFDLQTQATYPALEYCVQYRETDFNFLSRLLEDAGITYFFEHQNGKHIMVLGDDTATFKKVVGYDKVKFAQAISGRTTVDTIESWWSERVVQAGAYATTDFNFEKPSLSLLKSVSQSRSYAHSGFEVFDFPAASAVPAADPNLAANDVDAIAKIRLDEAQTGYERYHGSSSDCGGLRTGAKFKLTGHPQDAFNARTT